MPHSFYAVGHFLFDSDQVYFRTYKDTVAYGYAATSEKGAALLDETIFAYADRFAVVYIERRKYCGTLRKRLVENIGHELTDLFLCLVARIHLRSLAYGDKDIVD